MRGEELASICRRAFNASFSREKGVGVFIALSLCAVCIALCRTLSLGAGPWMQWLLAFFPFCLCIALLMGLGPFLVFLYSRGVDGKSIKIEDAFGEIKGKEQNLLLPLLYFALPILFLYLLLWMGLGLFYLLKAVPAIGSTLSSILAVGPFLITLASLLLACGSISLLFYLVPRVAFGEKLSKEMGVELFSQLRQSPFGGIALLLVALCPLCIEGGVFALSGSLIQTLYVEEGGWFAVGFKWLMIALPSCAFLTPAVVFFFNMAAETSAWMRGALHPNSRN